jgi:hypothetical protein
MRTTIKQPVERSDDTCCNSLLCELQDFMFFKQTIDDACKYVLKRDEKRSDNSFFIKGDNKVRTKEGVSKEKETLYKPRHKDSLFWCYYMLTQGLAACETVGNKQFIVEKNEKIKLVELMRIKKTTLKFHKMASLSSIEADLTSGGPISISTFFAICIASDLSVLYIDKVSKTWLNVLEEERGDTVNVLYRSDESQRFECETDVPSAIVNETEKTYYKLFSMNKPIQSLSSYKTAELLEICAKVGVDIYVQGSSGKTHPKQHLYNAIKNKLGV